MNRAIIIVILLLMILAFRTSIAVAQGGYEIASSTVNAGQVSRSGTTVIWGVAGQAESSVMKGGDYELTAGYGTSDNAQNGVFLPLLQR